MFASPSPVLFTLFGIKIYYYGVLMALAICAGVFVSNFIATKYYKLKNEIIIDLAPYLIVFGIIGARLYYCLMDFNFYLRFPTEILALRHGGISIHGAIIGGLIGLYIFSKRNKISALKLCDICAIGLPMGQAIGRWGNFFNSEAYGSPTNLPWKLYIAPQYRIIPYQDCDFFHPAFLYESILDILIFCVLFYILKSKAQNKDGQILYIYLILYSFARIFIELFRLDSVRYFYGVPVAIIVSVCIIILACFLMLKSLKK